MQADRDTLLAEREIDCPRCHQQCGWCSDPRWLHGTLRLPGVGKRGRNAFCGIPGYEPEGGDCPICSGSRRVMATTTYRPLRALSEISHAD